MKLGHFICAVGFSVSDLFLPSQFRALRDDSRLCTNERVLIPLSHKSRVRITDQVLSKIFCDCAAADTVAALLTLV